MPELPDITVYIDCLTPRVLGRTLDRITIRGPSLLRTFDPPLEAAEGRVVRAVQRLGKRIVLGLEPDLFLVLHLMIAGRLRWKEPGARPAGKIDSAAFGFDSGTLVLTEAGTQKRASLHLVRGEAALGALDPGGIDPLSASVEQFAAALRRENHTLKRALTDPRLLSGIGNAYGDEILHAARLSPVRLTRALTDDEIARLHAAARETLHAWISRLRQQFGIAGGSATPGVGRFPGPGEITAFRPGFAAHGRFGRPCPACGTAIQRIVHAESETNYCPRCQTSGRVLADRALSRLLKNDWPRTIEEIEDA